jgi:hypothetical protein
MKLEKVLDNLNSFEKNSFLKIIDNLSSNNPKNSTKIDKILNNLSSKDLRNMDNINISKVFNELEGEFISHVKGEFVKTTSQLDILIDIISREGNSIMKLDWFSRLYEKELNSLSAKIKGFKKSFEDEKSELSDSRKRDYQIYLSCLKTAYQNDDLNNQERKITFDEQSILLTLSTELGLSQEEIKLMNYMIVPVQKQDVEVIINELKSIGIIFFSRKNNAIYVADEVVRLLRKIRGKEVSDKFFRRVLRVLKEPQINLICKQHGIDWKLDLEAKIGEIIKEGISFVELLKNDIHKANSKLTEKKNAINTLIENGLKIETPIKGVLIEEKISNLINYFDEIDKDEKVGISIDGYDKLLQDINVFFPKFSNLLRNHFEFQEENVLKSDFLLDYNIKPRDILELLPEKDLQNFANSKEIKTRGDIIVNLLEGYKDSDNLYLENYENIGFRDLSSLKANGINIKEVDLGGKFEELTKKIFTLLGLM